MNFKTKSLEFELQEEQNPRDPSYFRSALSFCFPAWSWGLWGIAADRLVLKSLSVSAAPAVWLQLLLGCTPLPGAAHRQGGILPTGDPGAIRSPCNGIAELHSRADHVPGWPCKRRPGPWRGPGVSEWAENLRVVWLTIENSRILVAWIGILLESHLLVWEELQELESSRSGSRRWPRACMRLFMEEIFTEHCLSWDFNSQ